VEGKGIGYKVIIRLVVWIEGKRWKVLNKEM